MTFLDFDLKKILKVYDEEHDCRCQELSDIK